MPKASQWTEIFRNDGKEKVRVRVGEKYEEMTATQACRFDELTHSRKPDSLPDATSASGKNATRSEKESDSLKVSKENGIDKSTIQSEQIIPITPQRNSKTQKHAVGKIDSSSPKQGDDQD